MITMRKGATGQSVRELQTMLGIVVDGVFGPDTYNAVVYYQMAHNLVADGIVGEQTWHMLTSHSVPIVYKPLSVHITPCRNRPIRYIAIHYTAGSNSRPGRALSVFDTFSSRPASADYCVDDRDIVRFNPDIRNNYCWAVGDVKSNNNGGTLYGVATNVNTISIEVCSSCSPADRTHVSVPNHPGWRFSAASLQNAVLLTRYLMYMYNIPLDHVVRHYDISGKVCPGVIGWNEEPIYHYVGNQLIRSGQCSNSDRWIEFLSRL